MLSPRNKIEVVPGYTPREIDALDTLYDICNTEFTGRNDVHISFARAPGIDAWAQYYLIHEVKHVAYRAEIYCSFHMAYVIAMRLSTVWFAHKEMA
jgi:hypothetical protein